MSPVEGTAVLTFYLSYLASSYRTSLDIRFLLLLYTVVPNYPWSCPLYCTMCLFESFIKSKIFKYDCETLFCDLTFLRLKSRSQLWECMCISFQKILTIQTASHPLCLLSVMTIFTTAKQ